MFVELMYHYIRNPTEIKNRAKNQLGMMCTVQSRDCFLMLLHRHVFLWENQDIIDDIVIINLFSICYFAPIGFVLLPKSASRQKTFKIAYLTLTVQHRACCKYQN